MMSETGAVKDGVPVVSTTAVLAEKQNQIHEHTQLAESTGGVPLVETRDFAHASDPKSESDETARAHAVPPLNTADSGYSDETGAHGKEAAQSQSAERVWNIDEVSAQPVSVATEDSVSAGLTIPAHVVEEPIRQAEAELDNVQHQPTVQEDPNAMDTESAAQYEQPTHFADEQDLEVDERDDSDSAMGSDTESLTTSLSSSIYHYRKEHGRTYHAYKDGKYIFPNDEREASRLDLQHHLFLMTFNSQLYFAPITPRHALDVGTGTGIWAMNLADQLPECQVIGIDLSPGQPTLVPPNLKFIVDDVEDLWLYQEKFDLIHARLMAGAMADWPKFFRQSYENLEPGGWLEIQDYGLPVRSADGTHEGTNILRWGELLCEASKAMGRLMGSDACNLYAQQMVDAGFVDVQQRMFMWPTNSWPRDPFMKELGKWNMINCLDGLEGFCLALFTRGLGWKKEEVDIFVAQITKDFKDRKIHAYFPMPVIFGRRPYEHERVFQ